MHLTVLQVQQEMAWLCSDLAAAMESQVTNVQQSRSCRPVMQLVYLLLPIVNPSTAATVEALSQNTRV